MFHKIKQQKLMSQRCFLIFTPQYLFPNTFIIIIIIIIIKKKKLKTNFENNTFGAPSMKLYSLKRRQVCVGNLPNDEIKLLLWSFDLLIKLPKVTSPCTTYVGFLSSIEICINSAQFIWIFSWIPVFSSLLFWNSRVQPFFFLGNLTMEKNYFIFVNILANLLVFRLILRDNLLTLYNI